METPKYNESVFALFAEALNKKDKKVFFALGMKHGELPSLLCGGNINISKETIIEFLRMTADELEKNSISLEHVGSFDQSKPN